MASSRFGASKYRNATASIPHPEEWYRGALPAAAALTTTSSVPSSFSSNIKTNRNWIITVTQTGELSCRSYDGFVTSMRVGSGGGIGDWDLSRLEDGLLVLGGLDGAISVYNLPSSSNGISSPVLVKTILCSSSPITNVALHPTTSGILLVSTLACPATIYDLSVDDTSPSAVLEAKEPKGMWSVAWKADGRLIAGVGKSGAAYIWDPRSNKDAMVTQVLPIQALKSARLAWIDEDLFLTSFSKTRNRQYSLLSGSSLSAIFTQCVDTNPGILMPIVDHERKIIYVAGRGDMIVRQVELSGSQGYQETLHSLQFPISTSSLAAVHPARLEVMKAEIAKLLVPVIDKDGDALLPVIIKVPRRQLIDYHEDLYPDVAGTVPEQSSVEWIHGGNRLPFLISLDPSRRHIWEEKIEKLSKAKAIDSDASITKQIMSESTNSQTDGIPCVSVIPNSSSAPAAEAASPFVVSSTFLAAATPPVTLDSDLPPLFGNENHTSPMYKVRIMGDFLIAQAYEHRRNGGKGPLMVGLQGPQGCGKTTLAAGIVPYLKEKGLTSSVLSIDDLYKTRQGLKEIAQKHHDNVLLAGRGLPGTHDVGLAVEILEKVRALNDTPNSTVEFPIFDKSLYNGEGDRSSMTTKVIGPLDVFVLEGWSMGFAALSETDLEKAYTQPSPVSPTTSRTFFTSHPISSIRTINSYLAAFASSVYPYLISFIQIEPESYEYVFEWRLEQEHHMKAKNSGKGMTDEQVAKFVERYMPGYELWKGGIWAERVPWRDCCLKLKFGKHRDLIKISAPSAPKTVIANDQGHQREQECTLAQENYASSELRQEAATQVEPSPSATHSQQYLPKLSNTTQQGAKSQVFALIERFNPKWSRRFLAAKTPLIPTYNSIPSPSSLHQDSQILKLTPYLAFFPIQGTGGRLCVHPLRKKGRLAVGGEGYLTAGVEIVDFDVELGAGKRLAIAGEDGVVKIWKIEEDGVQGTGTAPNQILHGQAIDKISQILFHPSASDLLVGVTNNHSCSYIRFWDLSKGEEVKKVEIPASGVFRIAFNSTGNKVAVGTKDGRLLVFDPRYPTSISVGKAHDSPRPFQISWIDDQHLITIGFSRGSQRKLFLYRLPISLSGEIVTIASLTIDVSPSVLFPVYDPDTSILFAWGKGERVIQTYEIHPENERAPIVKLPGFTGDLPQIATAFLPKRLVDWKRVEIAKAFRLTAKTLEEVSFTIPRNKLEFFQDDIYVPTVDVESPSMTTAEWLDGKDALRRMIDLQPREVIPLSQAPKTESSAKKKFIPAKHAMSEQEQKQKEMDALFAKAKMDESSSDEEPPRRGLDPPDDNW
ncbi:hypothetical protein L204_100334 [Cryptococcus depauperatus]|nr:actin cross-linking [Cryptococcus depauperatus CBS 7855]